MCWPGIIRLSGALISTSDYFVSECSLLIRQVSISQVRRQNRHKKHCEKRR
jgi:hypothetical protein